MVRLLAANAAAAPAADMVRHTLGALADVLGCDVACLTERRRDGLTVIHSWTRPGVDGATTEAWPFGPAAEEAVAAMRVAVRDNVSDADLPPGLRSASPRTGAWEPLIGDEFLADVLIVLRPGPDPLSQADLEILKVAASRMYMTLEAIERGDALERVARAGPELARYVDVDALLEHAVELMKALTGADAAFYVTIVDGVFDLVHHIGSDPSVPRRWPRTTATMPNWDQLSSGLPYVGPRETNWDRPDETVGSPVVLCVPVMHDGQAVALLGATGHRARTFGKTSIDIARILSHHLSSALANAELYRRLTEREKDLRHQATHDPLTGLANRVTIGRCIDDALRSSPNGSVGVMFCDVDQFKAVNDRLGHEAGDELLQLIAARLATAVRGTDVLARFGGDEFVLLFGQMHDLADLTEAGRRVQLSLADPIVLRGERLEVSVSVGAVLGRRDTTSSVMLRNADAAMYAAKSKGQGRVEVFDDAASDRSLDWLDLRSELNRALARGELTVLYQPLVDLRTNAVRSFEALVRWVHPQRGHVPPDMFIPMAEETGAIMPIGAWVLGEACASLLGWQRLRPEAGLTVGVNISAVQLEPQYPDVLDVILKSGVDPCDVWLEVTERMDTQADITRQVNALRDAGVHFALDDFGMSYSSLTYLQRFPVEGIKIDRTFVGPMTEDETQRGIVRAILALGESLSVNVVAEGIETEQQRDALIELGCIYGQGYLLGRPMAADECHRLLRTSA